MYDIIFIREYVYIPMGGNRVSKIKLVRNIMFVWLLTGIWHGASWNFLIWGLYYGVLLLLEKFIFLKVKEKLPAIINIAITLVFVLIGWVLFYYVDIRDGIHHLKCMFGVGGVELVDAKVIYYFKEYVWFIIVGILACIPWVRVADRLVSKNIMENEKINNLVYIVKPAIITVLFVVSVVLLVGQSYNPFLYFRF